MGIFDRFRRPDPDQVVPTRAAGSTLGEMVADRAATAGMESTALQAMQAAVGATSEVNGPGLAPIPGRIQRDPRSNRARFYARRVGFVRRTYRFYAYQGARAPLTFERSLNGGVDWEPVPVEDDLFGNAVVQTIKGPGGTSAELVRPALYLDGTVGEFMFFDVTSDGATPAFIVRDCNACEKKKRGSRTVRRGDKEVTASWIIKNQEGARAADGPGAILEVSADRAFRHWQPDEEWHLVATSSLMGVVDDLDTYWSLLRQLRREVNSRLAMNNIFWTPTEAHVTKVPGNPNVSKLQASFAQAAMSAANDVDDSDIASVAAFMVDTPDEYKVPEIIEVPSLGSGLLTYLQDARAMVAASLPLSSSQILEDGAGENHWSEWLGDQKDLEQIGEGLRRVLDTFTTVVLRPALDYGLLTGAWQPAPQPAQDDQEALPGPTDPMMYRVGYDEEVIRRVLDLSEAAQWAMEKGYIHDDAGLAYMHFKDTDRPDETQWAAMLLRRKEWADASTTAQQPSVMVGSFPTGAAGEVGPGTSQGPQATQTAPAQLPAGGPVPNNGVPPTPALPAAKAAAGGSVVVVDDKWLLGK